VILTGSEPGELHDAPMSHCPAGIAYQVENGALAKFQVTNLSDERIFLYYVSIIPTGQLDMGPLLNPANVDVQGLVPRASDVGHSFQVRGMPGSVAEKRILCSPKMIWELFSPPTPETRAVGALDPSVLSHVQMQTVWYQIPESDIPRPTDVQTIISAFAL
jgi:hypothetical protein